jgi:hypothetical protein
VQRGNPTANQSTIYPRGWGHCCKVTLVLDPGLSSFHELSTQASQGATSNSPVNTRIVSSVGSGHGKAVVNMYSSWENCASRTVGLLVLQVPPDERYFATPRYLPMRHLVTWLILFYFVVTTGYCAGLATLLTIPR